MTKRALLLLVPALLTAGCASLSVTPCRITTDSLPVARLVRAEDSPTGRGIGFTAFAVGTTPTGTLIMSAHHYQHDHDGAWLGDTRVKLVAQSRSAGEDVAFSDWASFEQSRSAGDVAFSDWACFEYPGKAPIVPVRVDPDLALAPGDTFFVAGFPKWGGCVMVRCRVVAPWAPNLPLGVVYAVTSYRGPLEGMSGGPAAVKGPDGQWTVFGNHMATVKTPRYGGKGGEWLASLPLVGKLFFERKALMIGRFPTPAELGFP
ncbi:MAG: hypothetical protein J5J06_19345 [Phycisphaerae bacterium]|nr:hypothetical protein [Phycisphaerae bacterium]